MVGYLINNELGSVVYNLGHNYILGLIVTLAGITFHANLLIGFGIIIVTHVGLDRLLGFGLKYPTKFKDTHLQKV